MTAALIGCERTDPDTRAWLEEPPPEPLVVPSATPVTTSWRAELRQIHAGRSDRLVLNEPLTEADWQEVTSAPGLRVLHLEGGCQSLPPLSRLAELPQLEQLVVRGLTVDDADVEALRDCRSLRWVNLPDGRFSDQGLAALGQLPRLELLRFHSSQVSPEGFVHLANCRSLRFLHLIDIALDDGVISVIAGLERLESFYADGASISDEGWLELFQRRPDLHVHVDQVHHDRDPRKDHAPQEAATAG